MAIKKFLKLYVIIISLLCIPLLGTIKAANGTEVLENQSADPPLVAINENQNDWNTWATIDHASSDVNSENHKILLASSNVESHSKANASSSSSKVETLEDFLE